MNIRIESKWIEIGGGEYSEVFVVADNKILHTTWTRCDGEPNCDSGWISLPVYSNDLDIEVIE